MAERRQQKRFQATGGQEKIHRQNTPCWAKQQGKLAQFGVLGISRVLAKEINIHRLEKGPHFTGALKMERVTSL